MYMYMMYSLLPSLPPPHSLPSFLIPSLSLPFLIPSLSPSLSLPFLIPSLSPSLPPSLFLSSYPHSLPLSLPLSSFPHTLTLSLSPSLSLPFLIPSLSPSLPPSLFLSSYPHSLPLSLPLSSFPHTLTLSLHPSPPNLTVDKLALILHFMPGGMEGMTLNNWKPHKYIKLTLAYGFCQMVRLIQSKDSMVITRVQYCLGNLRKKSIEVSFVQWWSPDNHVICNIFIWQ